MATTHFDSSVYFSPTATAAGEAPTQAEFEAVTDWVKMEGLISAPSFGSTDQYVSQNLLSQTIESTQKTVATSGEGDLVAEYRSDSTAQTQWADAGVTTRNYFLKQELSDAPSPTMTNTINYNYGLIGRQRQTEASGPEAFVNIIQPVKMNAHELTVRPTTI